MVTTHFIGRYGNQLFQAAACIALAVEHNTRFLFPDNTESGDKNYLEHLPKLSKSQCQIGSVYFEPMFKYQPIPYGPDMCLHGFFQSEQYFANYREYILDRLKLRPDYYDLKQNRNVVSIHVRRGDYLLRPDITPFLGIEYYRQAIKRFADAGFIDFLVFSDDIPWCKENINFDNFNNCYFEYSEGGDEYTDMLSMAACSHNVIANSSFSWWGAWSNPNPDKIVVAPDRSNWMGCTNNHYDTSTLIPSGWETIKYFNELAR